MTPMLFALIAILIVAAVSLGVAFVTFKFLKSSAKGKVKGWSFGGAFAAFVFTAGLLTTLTLQIYNPLAATKDYERQIQELQLKLIKGAPCPAGYEVEVDEKRKLVFARPSDWEENFSLEYLSSIREGDSFRGNFNMDFDSEEKMMRVDKSFDRKNPNTERIYEELKQLLVGSLEKDLKLEVHDVHTEVTYVDSLRSSKIIVKAAIPSPSGEGVEVRWLEILTYVPHEGTFYFTFFDDDVDFLKSSEVFNNVINSIRFLSAPSR